MASLNPQLIFKKETAILKEETFSIAVFWCGGFDMRTVAIGIQDFNDLIQKKYFYVDKTAFIKEWWEAGDSVTLIARPRRFGKTLNMSMVNRFFSNEYAENGKVFEELFIWKEEGYRNLQGTLPVINLSFANVKEDNFSYTYGKICQILYRLYLRNLTILAGERLPEEKKEEFRDMMNCLKREERSSKVSMALNLLSELLYDYYGKKVIILLDEYDTPMQEAYVNGFWKEIVSFTRSLFNSTFKTNLWLERGLMTGITRVSKESIFSDLNNLKVVTTTSDEYATSFGFTEQEVFAALEEWGLSGEKERVRTWYDGFIFGTHRGIYNPWSILNFLDTEKYDTYWANTSANSLAGKLIREGSRQIKVAFGKLLQGEHIRCAIDEQIMYNQLDDNESAIWSLLLASGYLKVLDYEREELVEESEEVMYELMLTNYEVERMFNSMVRGWFTPAKTDYNDFVKALLQNDKKAMNVYMNRVALASFSYFDTGKNPSGQEPERFYHGFVLGLMVELQNRYLITSNRESGFGRYDVVLEPKNGREENAIIMEFKVHDPEDEASLKDTVQEALAQINRMNYEVSLLEKGIPAEHIYKYGFAFEGKKVLIG